MLDKEEQPDPKVTVARDQLYHRSKQREAQWLLSFVIIFFKQTNKQKPQFMTLGFSQCIW